jgi:2-keto-4-pentenoate hydratase/2-oxohepta-3-ene-1,7-dioic acid hydratase in catechol pathway
VMRRTATPVLAKSFPGCAPLGASVLGVEEIADRDSIGVRSWVNGEPRQDGRSSGLIFSIPDLLSRISWFSALEPGDVVLTGTPTGTGQDRGVFLAPGDTVRIEVDGVLPLLTHVVAPS